MKKNPMERCMQDIPEMKIQRWERCEYIDIGLHCQADGSVRVVRGQHIYMEKAILLLFYFETLCFSSNLVVVVRIS